MTPQEKVEHLKAIAEEIITEEELLKLFQTKEHPVCYDGFEPSGIAPIHFGLLRALYVKKLLETGVHVILFLADFHGMINNKLGGDLEKIKTAGKYFIEVWKAAGINTNKVEVVWASDLLTRKTYIERLLRVSKELTLDRVTKTLTIAGRNEKDKLIFAQFLYPAMQVSDIFELDLDMVEMGMDQRRANVIAREVAHKLHWKVPVAIHHHMLLGLKGTKEGDNPEEVMVKSKMSKSDPTSAIYMHDSASEIAAKIKTAFCPPLIVAGNPVLEYVKYIIMLSLPSFKIERTAEHGGDKEYQTFDEVTNDYESGALHPMDLKAAVARDLDILIKPVREHFENNAEAKKLYETVKSFQITR
ncbi:MAG: tyrosine--tRNA ligase [candidate division WWE3 bacterium]|nr:tyrosine--tRNA ligase [candidate division WWE3 bacterium]